MRFLLIPAFDKPYDLRMMIRFGQALCSEGHDAAVMMLEHRNAKTINGFDIVIEVNRPRPDFLNKRSLHVAWVQDVDAHEKQLYGVNCAPHDLVYCQNEPEWMGLRYTGSHYAGILYTGVLEEWLHRPVASVQDIDFGLCAFITYPLPAWDGPDQELMRLCGAEVARIFQPCRGNYKINEAIKAMVPVFDEWNTRKYREFCANPANANVKIKSISTVREDLWQKFAPMAGEIVKDVARLIDRQTIARLALSVSNKVRLRGFNWELHEEFKPYWAENTPDEELMFSDFRRIKINLHNNFSGFGLHSRVLECMAVGGFIGSHTTAEPEKAGRLRNDFEPDKHFCEFTPTNFADKTRAWLQDDAGRRRAIRECRRIITSKHLWKHRAQQIIKDLNLHKAVYDAPQMRVVNF